MRRVSAGEGEGEGAGPGGTKEAVAVVDGDREVAGGIGGGVDGDGEAGGGRAGVSGGVGCDGGVDVGAVGEGLAVGQAPCAAGIGGDGSDGDAVAEDLDAAARLGGAAEGWGGVVGEAVGGVPLSSAVALTTGATGAAVSLLASRLFHRRCP